MRIVEPVNAIYPQKNDILKYRNLILKCLRGIRVPHYTTIDDIKQQAWLGLCIADAKFDHTKRCRFSTYAYYYIRGYINRMLYSNFSLLSRLGYETIKFHPEKIPSMISIIERDDDNEENDRKVKTQLISEENTNKVDDRLDYYKLKKIYNKCFYILSSKQREAIEKYFFTLRDDGKKYKMEDVAKELNIDISTVSRRIEYGCRALRNEIGKYLDVYV